MRADLKGNLAKAIRRNEQEYSEKKIPDLLTKVFVFTNWKSSINLNKEITKAVNGPFL
jgi:hypothetical protein